MFTIVQTCRNRRRLGCENSPSRPEGASKRDSRNLAFTLSCISVHSTHRKKINGRHVWKPPYLIYNFTAPSRSRAMLGPTPRRATSRWPGTPSPPPGRTSGRRGSSGWALSRDVRYLKYARGLSYKKVCFKRNLH